MKKIAFISSELEYFRSVFKDDLATFFEVREFEFERKTRNFDELIAFNADYNFFFRGEYIPAQILSIIRGLKIALSSEPFPRKINGKWNFVFDSVRRYLFFRMIYDRKFDYIFHYDISSADLFNLDGVQISGEFIFPVSRRNFFPRESEKKWDLFFIGRSTQHREKFFLQLKNRFNFLHIAHGIWDNELAPFIHRSTICLNAHASPEISWEPRLQTYLAAGAFVLSEKITPNSYLRPGIEFIEYSTPDDLQEKVEYYLQHKDGRDVIVSNALKRIEEYFDPVKSFKKLINKIDKSEYRKFHRLNAGHWGINCLSYFAQLYSQLKRSKYWKL